MRVGLRVPAFGWRATPGHIVAHAEAAEAHGFDSLWVSDHVVMPREHSTPYTTRFKVEEAFLEPVALLAFLAAVTQRVELGTSVLVLPMRQPVLHAKMLATIDHLAGGRLILGAGVGWCREEFEVLSAPFARRGRRMDEILQLYRAFWTEDWVDFHGEFYEVDGWTSRPRPPRRVPIWMGGESDAQLRRAAVWGDGWISQGRGAPRLRENIARLHAAAEAAGRDPAELTIAIHSHVTITADAMPRAAAGLAELKEAGVQHALTTVDLRETDRVPELIARFAEDHLARLQAD